MAYKVLYRKYRPSTFSEIVGQEVIVKTLQNSIINDKISHAYLFTGPRGTGKTSTAKVLAKVLNCQNIKNGEACGKCDSCKNFNSSPDILEIDAASNNGVEEIRELRNNISLAPSVSKYKVYIIDEVHMLSSGAFNALLKTLEEPPEHAIFILATTEVYKVPITILSRCQRFDFKKITEEDMSSHLKEICKKEKIDCNDDVIKEIYNLSDGCMRDALSILDQNSKLDGKVTIDELENNYEIVTRKSIDELLDSIKTANVKKTVEIIDTYANNGMNSQKLIKGIIRYLNQIAVDCKLHKINNYDFNKIKKIIMKLNDCYIDARINDNVFDIIKLSFLEEMDEISVSSSEEKVLPKENEEKPKDKSLIDIRINNCFSSANKESLTKIKEIWDEAKKQRINNINLSDYSPIAASDANIIFTSEDESLANLMNVNATSVEKVVKKLGFPAKVVGISSKKWDELKKEFILNKQKGIKYEYIEEPKKTDKGNKIKEEVNQIFESEIVEIS